MHSWWETLLKIQINFILFDIHISDCEFFHNSSVTSYNFPVIYVLKFYLSKKDWILGTSDLSEPLQFKPIFLNCLQTTFYAT